jgi:MFS family permease
MSPTVSVLCAIGSPSPWVAPPPGRRYPPIQVAAEGEAMPALARLLRSIPRSGWTALAVLVLVGAAACVAQAFGRFTYGVVLPAVRDDLLGGSNVAAGLLGTANVAAYLVGTMAVATISTRVSLLRLIQLGLVLSTTGLLMASVAGTGAVLGLALVVMGLGGAAIWIPSPGVASTALSPARRGLATGLVGAGLGSGIVFAGRLAEALRRGADDDEWWRQLYRIEGLIGVGVLVATALFLRRAVASRRDPLEPGTSAPRRATYGLGGFGALRRVHGWAALTAAYATYGFMYLLVVAFLVARLEDDAGFRPGEASAMFSLVGLAAVFGGVLLGPLSDRIGRRSTLVGAFLVFAVATLAILSGRQPWVLLGAIGIGLMFSGLPTVIAAYVVDATDAATYGPAYAAATLAFGVAQAVSPQIGGIIADVAGSFTPVFLLSAAFAVLGAACSSRLPAASRTRTGTSRESQGG